MKKHFNALKQYTIIFYSILFHFHIKVQASLPFFKIEKQFFSELTTEYA